jgi:hypothetical protein
LCNNLQQTFRSFAVICGAALTFAGATALSNVASAQTPAAAPAAPAATPWTYQGLFDAYIQADGNSPKGVATGSNVTGFGYDEEIYTPALSLAELNIAKAAPAAGGLGFKTTLIAGETANINDPSGTEEGRYQNVQQLYVTYTGKTGAGIEAGKFYTPFGYEVTESNANLNYSRSFIFSDLLPVYHVGISAYTQSYNGLIVTGYLVRDLLNGDLVGNYSGLKSPSSTPGFMGNLNYTAPNGKYTAIESIGYDNEDAKPVNEKTLLSDTDVTFTPTSLDTIGGEFTYREDNVGPFTGHEDGVAGYYKRQISSTYSAAFRAEYIESYGDSKPHADSLTATLSDQTTKSLLLRLELRHDDTDQDSNADPATITVAPFLGGNAGTTASQNTLSVSGVYTFGP